MVEPVVHRVLRGLEVREEPPLLVELVVPVVLVVLT
jgi:hypothetical protein